MRRNNKSNRGRKPNIMKILVTGGAGYIGSTLIPMLLEEGHEVTVLDSLLHGGESLLSVWSHPGLYFKCGDIRDRQLVSSCVQETDAIIHLAAIVGDPACARQPDLARQINMEGSLELLDLARKSKVSRFVFASTCSNYGRMADPTELVDETSELQPISLYAETKVAVEQAILNTKHCNEFCPTVLRLATVFGVSPRMRFDLTVNQFTMEMLSAEPLVVFGGHFWRPYVHVRDVARAFLLVLSSPQSTVKNQVFNVGATSQNYQKDQLVELIRPFAPNSIVEHVHKEEDPRDYRVSFNRISQNLGFKITRSVEDGIRELVSLARSGIICDFKSPKYRN